MATFGVGQFRKLILSQVLLQSQFSQNLPKNDCWQLLIPHMRVRVTYPSFNVCIRLYALCFAPEEFSAIPCISEEASDDHARSHVRQDP